MKRFFPVIISVILLCSMVFTGCSSNENTTASTKDAIDIHYDLLDDKYKESGGQITFSDFSDTVTAWAKENNINVDTVNDKYLVLSKDASGSIKNVESFTFHAAVDLTSEKNIFSSFSSAATVMTVLSNAQNHGTLRGIFTLVKNGQPVGASALNADYLNYDNFIDVTYSTETTLTNTVAGSSKMLASKQLTIAEPIYTKAYKIEFSGITGLSAYENHGTYPNPIKTIGDLLASCQTSTVLFELAAFEGGIYADNIPENVTATIVLHENDVESFTKKFNNSYEKVANAYKEAGSNESFEYTMTAIDLPSEVICKEDTENIVSLMYTMINGTYLRDENDQVRAFTNIGKITTKNGIFKLSIDAKSLDDEVMTELQGVVKTICGLSDINYKRLSNTKVWTNDIQTPLIQTLSENLHVKCSSVLEIKHITEFIDTNNSINLISWGTNKDDANRDLKKIFEYMSIAGVEIVTEK